MGQEGLLSNHDFWGQSHKLFFLKKKTYDILMINTDALTTLAIQYHMVLNIDLHVVTEIKQTMKLSFPLESMQIVKERHLMEYKFS